MSSSDAVLFKVHRRNLEVHSVAFADAERTTVPEDGAEFVAFSETSDVLDLLFQYMYPQPQPDLEGVDFPLLACLAEAAEKYEVHTALGWTQPRKRMRAPEHGSCSGRRHGHPRPRYIQNLGQPS